MGYSMVNATIGQNNAITEGDRIRQRAQALSQPIGALFQEGNAFSLARPGRQHKLCATNRLVNPDCNPPGPDAAPDRHFDIAPAKMQNRFAARQRLRPRPPNLRR